MTVLWLVAFSILVPIWAARFSVGSPPAVGALRNQPAIGFRPVAQRLWLALRIVSAILVMLLGLGAAIFIFRQAVPVTLAVSLILFVVGFCAIAIGGCVVLLRRWKHGDRVAAARLVVMLAIGISAFMFLSPGGDSRARPEILLLSGPVYSGWWVLMTVATYHLARRLEERHLA